ncbi:MAG: hypothetical protein KDD32_09205 [Bacteroidetes bacterium]|nr:hypothetical protein [Bacteroidota bacterium]
MPKEKEETKKEAEHLKVIQAIEEEMMPNDVLPDLPTSLNEELSEKIKDNPNKFIGCGG